MSAADRRAAKTGAHDQVTALLARVPATQVVLDALPAWPRSARPKVVASLRRGPLTPKAGAPWATH